MMKKWLILGLAWLLVACGTRDEVAAATPISPSHTPTPTVTPIPPTQTPTRLYATITRQPTATYTPTPTPKPTTSPASLPQAHLLFMRDDQLWNWLPTTNETTLLLEGVERILQAEGDVLVFTREIPTENSFSILVYHLPTQTEQEIVRLPAQPLGVQLSPDGHLIALVTGLDEYAPLLTIYRLDFDPVMFAGIEIVFTHERQSRWYWPHDRLLWVSPAQLSWNDPEGIWLLDLNETNPVPQVVILPSTNQFETPSRDAKANSEYIPYRWSPDGHYLLVIEYFYEGGDYRVIDRVTGRSFVIPDVGLGPSISDEVVWLNETHLAVLSIRGEISVWQITQDSETLMALIKSTTLPQSGVITDVWLDSSGQLRFFLVSKMALMVWDSVTGEFSILNEVNVVPSYIYWSPDGNWALLEPVTSKALLVGLMGQEPIGLDPILDDYSCCYWQWYLYPTAGTPAP